MGGYGVRRFVAEGSPADCKLFFILKMQHLSREFKGRRDYVIFFGGRSSGLWCERLKAKTRVLLHPMGMCQFVKSIISAVGS